MNSDSLVAIVTDGSAYWTELFQGDNPQGTFARHVDQQRWGSASEARENSPWWPAGNPGVKPEESHERMHRALCSWGSCSHQVIQVAHIKA